MLLILPTSTEEGSGKFLLSLQLSDQLLRNLRYAYSGWFCCSINVGFDFSLGLQVVA